MRLLVTRPMPQRVVAALEGRFDITWRARTDGLSPAELRASLADYDLVLPTLGDFYTAAVFADVARPRAQLLANFGVGYNHIDVAAAKAAGVAVTNTPGAVTDATADIAMMLVLMTARRAGEGERLLRAGRWRGWHPTELLGLHVTGKRIAIIGMGRIGRAIARRAHHGFGMEVVFANRSPVADPGVPARQVSLIEALTADFVVLAVPATPETFHLIGAAELARMQPHSVLVNISRGTTVDESALVAALERGTIAGAGLDVYEHEPEVSPGLLARENVTLLPHLGTATGEVRTAMGLMAVNNLLALAEGRALPNPV